MNSKRLKNLVGYATFGLLLFAQNVYGNAYGNINVSSSSTVNIRAGAGTEHKVINKVGTKDYIHILDKASNGWYVIETATDQLGYISGEFVDIQKAKAVVNSNSVNVRANADYNAPVISQMYKGNVVYAYSQTGDWYLIGNGEIEGYIHRDFIDGLLIDQLPNKKAVASNKTNTKENTIAVVTTTLNLRSKPSTSSDILKRLAPGNVLSVVHIGDEWVQVKDAEQGEGYIAREFVNIGKESAKSELLKGINQGSVGSELVSYAKQFLGNPYVYGGSSLTNGTDCSGFTSQIYKNFGISLSRSSAGQYVSNGVAVSQSEAQLGDLVFYGYNGNVSHVAIYIGDGQVIHANDERTGICISSAFRPNGKPVIGIKRVL